MSEQKPYVVAFATIAKLALCAAALGLLGSGVWMIGGGDWRGAGLAVVGGLVWVDLLLASRGAVAARTRPRGKA